ncbi:MAG: segregation/condensation protein A [Minisyncoccia bacterium]
MDSQFNVKTHVFEGPLELLLSLIEKRKLFINDISLAKVADDYISFIKEFESESKMADLAHFILVASTLVLIKSKSLLPTLDLSLEEQESIDDLEDRLKQYQKYKALSKHLSDRFGINTEYFRVPAKEIRIVFAPDKNTTINRLHEVIKSVILSIPKKEFVPKAVVQKVVSLEEMMENLSERITRSMKMSFKEFSSTQSRSKDISEVKVHVIVSFLAMLELVKQGIINVRQDKHFHDIEIETQSVGVPKY